MNKQEENICYKVAQKIDNYDEKKDGCIWGHTLENVEEAFDKGKKQSKKQIIELIKKEKKSKGEYNEVPVWYLNSILNKIKDIK